MAALTASAQTTTPPANTDAAKADQPVQLEALTVTGYRGSLQKSLDAKREATAIVDVITAEDVGKFPDTNVAESLAHFTGISIDHVFGEGEMVSILGTDPALNRVLVNGQTIASGQWGGSTNDLSGRTFNYTLLSPEIISQAELFKATEARIDEGSIGGTVIIHTRRPLDLPNNTMRASAGYAYNDRSEKGNWRGSLLGSWKTADKKFGILAAVTHDKEFLYRAGIEYWGYGSVSDTAGSYKVPFGMNSAYFKQERKRDGFQGALQWRPSDTFELNVTGVYIKGVYDNFSQSRYVVPAYWGKLDSYKTQGDFVVSGHVTAGDAVVDGVTLVGPAANPYNADGQYDTNLRKAPVSTQSLAVHGDYRPDGTWHVGFDAGHTQATGGKDPEYLFSLMFNQNYAFAYDGSKSSLTFDNAGVATDPTAYKTRRAIPSQYIVNGQYVNIDNADNGRYQAGGIEYTTTVDKEDFGQVDVDRPVDWGAFTKIRFGAKYTDHVNSQRSKGNFIPVTTILDLNSFKPSLSPANLFDGVGTSGDTAKMVVPEQDAVVSYLLGQPQGAMEEKKGQEWYVREQNSAAYLQTDFATGSIFSGNLGFRVVHTTDGSKYWNYDGNTGLYSKVKKDTSYTKLLPSANFVVDAAKDFKIRLGVAKVIARPRYSDLAGQFSVDNTRLTGSGGNPDLKPYESNNVNLALEYYLGRTGLLSAEFFLRDVKNYVLNVTQDKDLLNTSTGQTATYSISSPFNAGEAKVYGVAFTAQKDLAYGFGIQSNVTLSRSDTPNDYNMPYLSKTTYNIIPYFEKGPFSARVSYNWRSEFFTAIGRLNLPMFSDSYRQLDASASYQITKNIQIIVNASNLLDSTYFAYYQTKYAPMGVYKTGRMLTTSVSFKF